GGCHGRRCPRPIPSIGLPGPAGGQLMQPNVLEQVRVALARATDLRFFRRVQAVLLLARGLSIPEAAQITAAKPNAVYRWLRLYLRTHQADSLRDAPRPGRPRVASRIIEPRI